MDQVTLVIQDSVDGISQIPADPAHPQPIGGVRNARDLHLACGQIDEEQNDEPLEPREVHTSTEKKSAATISSQCRVRNSFQASSGSAPATARSRAVVRSQR